MTGFGSSCGACKFLRRKCSNECVFAPYFCYDEAASHFAAVHKVFGASNVSKLLLHLPLHNRSDAATTISYEAMARMKDPIYGCVAHIYALQQQIAYLQEEIEILGNQIAHNLTAGLASCGTTSEANNNNSNNNNNSTIVGSQLFSQHDSVNSLYCQNQQESLLSQYQNSIGNNTCNNNNNNNNQVLDAQMGINELQPLYGWGEEDVLCHSLSDPLEKLFEGIDQQENIGNNPWLDESPILENCIGSIWD